MWTNIAPIDMLVILNVDQWPLVYSTVFLAVRSKLDQISSCGGVGVMWLPMDMEVPGLIPRVGWKFFYEINSVLTLNLLLFRVSFPFQLHSPWTCG